MGCCRSSEIKSPFYIPTYKKSPFTKSPSNKTNYIEKSPVRPNRCLNCNTNYYKKQSQRNMFCTIDCKTNYSILIDDLGMLSGTNSSVINTLPSSI